MCGLQGIQTAMAGLRAGLEFGRMGGTIAQSAGTAVKIGTALGKTAQVMSNVAKIGAPIAKVAAPVAKVGNTLGTVAGLALSAKQLLQKPADVSSRALSNLSQMNPTDNIAKTASTIRANGANDIRRGLGSLRVPQNNSAKNAVSGTNIVSSLLGLNLGG